MNMRHAHGRTHQRLRQLVIGAAVGVLLSQLFSSQVLAAGSMYLSASPTAADNGSNVTVSLRINPSTPVTVVEGTINFNTAQLQYVSVDAMGSSFDTSIQQTVSGSKITIVRAKLDAAGVSSDALVVKVVFKALTQTGSSALTLTDANSAFDGVYTNPSASGTTITFKPATTNEASSTPPPKLQGSPTNAANDSKADAKDAARTVPGAPTVSEETINYTTFTVKATTATASTAYLLYGTSEDNLTTQTTPTIAGTSHSMTVIKGLTPGSKIFYQVVSTNGQESVSSETKSLTLKGFTIKITLMDKNRNLLPNQEVKLLPSNKTTTANEKGVATYTQLTPGDYTVTLSQKGVVYRQHVSVFTAIETDIKGTQTAREQQSAVIFDGYVSSATAPRWVWPVAGVGAFLVAAGLYIALWPKNAIAGRFAWRIRQRIVAQKGGDRQHNTPFPQYDTTSGVTPEPTDVKKDDWI